MTTIDKRKEEKVLRDYEKLIYKLANKSYLRYNRKYALEDILQEAKISAIRAYRNYDPSKNTKLITHLHNYINFYLPTSKNYENNRLNAFFSDYK
jgi:DNA-directed RNA polymerase specialized sigma subunit